MRLCYLRKREHMYNFVKYSKKFDTYMNDEQTVDLCWSDFWIVKMNAVSHMYDWAYRLESD